MNVKYGIQFPIIETEETMKFYTPGVEFFPEMWLQYDPVSFEESIKNLMDSKVVNRINITVDFSKEVDLEQLKAVLSNVVEFIFESIEKGQRIPFIPLLLGFLGMEKFFGWGNSRFFKTKDDHLFTDPSCEYEVTQDKNSEFWKQLTRPHLSCLICECFFCPLNIHHNRQTTTEWKIPSRKTCEVNTIFNQASMKILNKILDSNFLAGDLNVLDNREYDAKTAFEKINDNMCLRIKETLSKMVEE